MKTFLVFLLLSCMAFSVQAEEQSVSLELGSASGTTTWSTTDSSLSYFNGKLDHDLSGTALNIVYSKITDSNWIWGGGYHSYTVTGTSDTVSIINLTYSSTLSVSGLFGMGGYNVEINDALTFQPQARLGLANTATLETTAESDFGSGSNSLSESGSLLVIALPLVYSLGDWRLGVQLQSIGMKFTAQGTDETTVSTLDSAFLFTAGKSF